MSQNQYYSQLGGEGSQSSQMFESRGHQELQMQEKRREEALEEMIKSMNEAFEGIGQLDQMEVIYEQEKARKLLESVLKSAKELMTENDL